MARYLAVNMSAASIYQQDIYILLIVDIELIGRGADGCASKIDGLLQVNRILFKEKNLIYIIFIY